MKDSDVDFPRTFWFQCLVKPSRPLTLLVSDNSVKTATTYLHHIIGFLSFGEQKSVFLAFSLFPLLKNRKLVHVAPCTNILSQFSLGAIHWIWEFATFVFPLHRLTPATRPPELINYKTKLEILPVLWSSRNLQKSSMKRCDVEFFHPYLLTDCDITFVC